MDIQKEQILIVDDDELQLEVAKVMLQNEYKILTAKSGEEAIKYFRNGLIPDLVLLDIIMPEMDGWETFNKIRSISSLQNVPVAFLTAVNELVLEEHAFEMGVTDYIKKPYDAEDILCRIKHVLQKYESENK
jgi:CheY-like chemotaxis protein